MTEPGLLAGKRLLVTGIISDRSIAFSVARRLVAEGASIVVTTPPETLARTKRTVRPLADGIPVLPLDVTDPDQVRQATDELASRLGQLDGALHAIAFAPRSCFGGSMLAVPWEDVAAALHVSTYSLSVIAGMTRELAPLSGASIVGLDFDARLAWPSYNWMGVAKAALESLTRYLAVELGPAQIRVNLVAAGPMRSLAARAIPGFSLLEEVWDRSAPLGWDAGDGSAVAGACAALFSDLLRSTTGEIVHVDGGAHVVAVGGAVGEAGPS